MQLLVGSEQTEGSALSCRLLWIWTNCRFSATNFKACQEFQEATAYEGAV